MATPFPDPFLPTILQELLLGQLQSPTAPPGAGVNPAATAPFTPSAAAIASSNPSLQNALQTPAPQIPPEAIENDVAQLRLAQQLGGAQAAPQAPLQQTAQTPASSTTKATSGGGSTKGTKASQAIQDISAAVEIGDTLRGLLGQFAQAPAPVTPNVVPFSFTPTARQFQDQRLRSFF